jgi:tRNA-specific 2-thiouridylase
VRELAEQFGLRVAAKPDSQDICFVPDGDYASVVRRIRPDADTGGDIVHAETGATLGPAQGRHPLHRGPAPGWKSAARRAALCGGHRCAQSQGAGRPARMLAVGAARITETNRIGPVPEGDGRCVPSPSRCRWCWTGLWAMAPIR